MSGVTIAAGLEAWLSEWLRGVAYRRGLPGEGFCLPPPPIVARRPPFFIKKLRRVRRIQRK